MIIPKTRFRYTTDRKLIVGKGFLDSFSFSNIFKTIKPAFNSFGTFIKPTLNTVGTFLKQNKDQLLKPIIGAVGDLAATGISKGIPTLLSHIINRRTQKQLSNLQEQQPPPVVDKKVNEILNSILSREVTDIRSSIPTTREEVPTTNIIGDGIRSGTKIRSCTKREKRKKIGSGLKSF